MKKIFLLIAVFAGLLVGCGADVAPAPAFVETQAAQDVTSPLAARGVVESVLQRNVYSTLGFTVEHVYVEVGDAVAAGDVLARLDTGDLELQIRQQRLDLEAMQRMAELSPQQQLAELRAIREASANAVSLTRRLFDEARANLANNSNLHIIGAETALTAAELNLSTVQRNYEIAQADYAGGNNPQILAAESQLRAARLARDELQADYERANLLYEADGLSRNDLRQTEMALEHAKNAESDARTNLENAQNAERRALEQLSLALSAAVSTHADAVTMLETTRLAAEQEVEMLRGNLTAAQIAANLEPMEIAVDMAALEVATNVERLEIALELSERQLEDSVITAPIDGVVTAAIAREGASGAGLLFIVEDVEDLRVKTRFREYDIALLEPGMPAAITADATGGAIHAGEIRRISPAAVHDSPIVEFEVEIAIPPNTGLKIGMNTRIEIELE